MKKLDLGQAVSILANAGVIAGIVFLAFELRQNNALLESQARSSLDERRMLMQLNLVENAGGITSILVKAREGEPLTGEEQLRLEVRRAMYLYNFESIFEEITTGPLTEADIPAEQWAASFVTDPGMQAMWDLLADRMTLEFTEFMERRVFPIRDAYEEMGELVPE